MRITASDLELYLLYPSLAFVAKPCALRCVRDVDRFAEQRNCPRPHVFNGLYAALE
jgi:hypothetical protein